jgi:hypothetical protein
MALSTRSTSRPSIDVTRARQARLGRPVFWVLLASLILIALGFFATWSWKARDLSQAANQGQAPASAARTFDAPPPAAAARQNYQTGGPLAPQNQGNPGQPDRAQP